MADEFLHAATQAPQPIQAAAAKEPSALSFSIGMALASTALPVFTDIYPPACMILSKALRSTTRSFITGKAKDLQGSTTIVSPSLNALICNWQTVVACHGPCRLPLICIEQAPQIPSRQSWSKAIGSFPSLINCSFSTSIISRKDISDEISITLYVSNFPSVRLFFCLQIWSVKFIE